MTITRQVADLALLARTAAGEARADAGLSVLCRVRLHPWTRWEATGDGHHQDRTCPACGIVQRRSVSKRCGHTHWRSLSDMPIVNRRGVVIGRSYHVACTGCGEVGQQNLVQPGHCGDTGV